jgi:hypothetical protein
LMFRLERMLLPASEKLLSRQLSSLSSSSTPVVLLPLLTTSLSPRAMLASQVS